MPDIEDAIDLAVMTTAVTALLVRSGGHAEFTPEEWTSAILHEGSVFLTRVDDNSNMHVYLMRKPIDV